MIKEGLNSLLIFIIFLPIFFSCQGRKSIESENDSTMVERVSGEIGIVPDSVITELKYKDLTIQVVSSCKEGDLKPEEDLVGYPICKYQKVIFIRNNQRKYIDLPIELVERELEGGGKVLMMDVLVHGIDIYKGPKGEFVGFDGEGSCGTCPSFWAFYSLSGENLSHKYNRRNDDGDVVVISSHGSMKETFEKYGIDMSGEYVDISESIIASVEIDPYKNNLKEETSSRNEKCLKGKTLSLPLNDSDLNEENSMYLNQEVSCEKSIIEQIGDADNYCLVESKTGSYAMAIFTFRGDNLTKFLVTLENNKVISKLTVFRKWTDYTVTPNTYHNTTFEIDKDCTIHLKDEQLEGEKLLSSEEKTYGIKDDGEIVEVK